MSLSPKIDGHTIDIFLPKTTMNGCSTIMKANTFEFFFIKKWYPPKIQNTNFGQENMCRVKNRNLSLTINCHMVGIFGQKRS